MEVSVQAHVGYCIMLRSSSELLGIKVTLAEQCYGDKLPLMGVTCFDCRTNVTMESLNIMWEKDLIGVTSEERGAFRCG